MIFLFFVTNIEIWPDIRYLAGYRILKKDRYSVRAIYFPNLSFFPPPPFRGGIFFPQIEKGYRGFPKAHFFSPSPFFFPKVFFLNKFFPKPNFFLLSPLSPPSFSLFFSFFLLFLLLFSFFLPFSLPFSSFFLYPFSSA